MRSLAVKLTLAFLLIGLTGAVLVAVILQLRTRTAFNTFVVTREEQNMVDTLTQYYVDHSGWEGVASSYRFLQDNPQGPDFRRSPLRFTLVDLNHVVLASMQTDTIGQAIPANDLSHAIPIKVNNNTVGWLVENTPPPQLVPNSPEDIFLASVNQATLISGLIAIVLALALGGFLAFTMTRSLRELTAATNQIANGNLDQQVKIRSRDELGTLAASFNKMSRDLAHATQVRRQMTADIAHDLRTPLSVITGYSEALSDGKLPGTPEIYSILHDETLHLNKLIDDLRTLSLADVGELSLTLQPTPPLAMLNRVIARHTLASQQKEVALEVAASQDLPDVNVDPERMNQVFDNLVGNAFRYTPRGGKIVLSAAANGSTVIFRVSDNGKGIELELLPHIFDRFFRGDPSRTQNGESGLGLAIARSIVVAQGGTIDVESTLDQGTTFTIAMPVVEKPANGAH
jgi:two-component system sensor histidine kinase BaeS